MFWIWKNKNDDLVPRKYVTAEIAKYNVSVSNEYKAEKIKAAVNTNKEWYIRKIDEKIKTYSLMGTEKIDFSVYGPDLEIATALSISLIEHYTNEGFTIKSNYQFPHEYILDIRWFK